MFFDFHLASKGYAVISLGATVPLSNAFIELPDRTNKWCPAIGCLQRAFNFVTRAKICLTHPLHFVCLSMNQQRLRQLLPFFGIETEAAEKMRLARANPVFKVHQITQNFVALNNRPVSIGQLY